MKFTVTCAVSTRFVFAYNKSVHIAHLCLTCEFGYVATSSIMILAIHLSWLFACHVWYWYSNIERFIEAGDTENNRAKKIQNKKMVRIHSKLDATSSNCIITFYWADLTKWNHRTRKTILDTFGNLLWLMVSVMLSFICDVFFDLCTHRKRFSRHTHGHTLTAFFFGSSNSSALIEAIFFSQLHINIINECYSNPVWPRLLDCIHLLGYCDDNDLVVIVYDDCFLMSWQRFSSTHRATFMYVCVSVFLFPSFPI